MLAMLTEHDSDQELMMAYDAEIADGHGESLSEKNDGDFMGAVKARGWLPVREIRVDGKPLLAQDTLGNLWLVDFNDHSHGPWAVRVGCVSCESR